MKIITRKEFVKLPAETLFSYYEPCVFTDLMVKNETWFFDGGGSDFLTDSIIGAIENTSSDDFFEKCERMELGETVPMDFEFTGREGLFDEKQLFAVYEKEDVKKLIDRLQKCL